VKHAISFDSSKVFYRPVSNSNLISIQPVKDVDDEEDNEGSNGIENEGSDDESSSGSEYAVIGKLYHLEHTSGTDLLELNP